MAKDDSGVPWGLFIFGAIAIVILLIMVLSDLIKFVINGGWVWLLVILGSVLLGAVFLLSQN